MADRVTVHFRDPSAPPIVFEDKTNGAFASYEGGVVVVVVSAFRARDRRVAFPLDTVAFVDEGPASG